ncbi:hypothetical protein GCM10014715_04700 [Streptomyces spiralis]|uniref:Uncharacterized protein n=1 Tax=Streptomyces spiralis TaxID=66376 RepID=A0A918ZJF8_9ACTN|nr:hypothetical protein GCM10014715_04700 [Streptomyces spiralis]
MAALGFEPRKAEPADLQRAGFTSCDLRFSLDLALPGDAWGNESAAHCCNVPTLQAAERPKHGP